MGRQFAFLLALGLLAGSAASVSIAGWVLFVRDRRSSRHAWEGPSVGTPAASDASAER